ncbi:Receptor like protein [Trichinella spiralis]|uniref:Receptor like protein n=1 Tax=Trichinella spiralis TaxID=6334 RepID=A0ABR3K3H0_TRISP
MIACSIHHAENRSLVYCNANCCVCQRDVEFPTPKLRIQWKMCFVQVQAFPEIARMLHGCSFIKTIRLCKGNRRRSCPNCAVDLSRSFTSDSDMDGNG